MKDIIKEIKDSLTIINSLPWWYKPFIPFIIAFACILFAVHTYPIYKQYKENEKAWERELKS